MNLREVQRLLDAEILCGEEAMDGEVNTVFACDLMSDVLAFNENKTLLVTGLVNPHVIRTAEMMDINAIVFVRGKVPDEETLNLAKENGIVILGTKNILYTSCGILYKSGLIGAKISSE
ncbi:DRTGG domain-containing protein [Alkaliphilus hydrothermalis]|uniref:Transcriptional regulator n=1 Tax=Alkaliphilus hydrothermalis TaxID=1482730 RepID=A0ABS2NKW6_9FIRM|nr:DRTGG domain-containing protein [Alkaliphilus hydrothermalis]MBM7613563.1 putative transcriptional regulator [Alkaliphilus hydrothermalis]